MLPLLWLAVAPNVLLVVTDDHRADAWGLGSQGRVKTPNLDTLGRRGAVFENAFVTTSLCSPSRASILTGHLASRHGVTGLDGSLTSGVSTIAERLRKVGYVTGHVGKWHFRSPDPAKAGFDWTASFHANGPHFDRKVVTQGQPVVAKGMVDDWVADQGIGFLRRAAAQQRPFFLQLATQLPHLDHRLRWNPRPETLAGYADVPVPLPPKSDPMPWLARSRSRTQALEYGYADPEKLRAHIRQYWATITDLDAAIGRVLAALRELKLEESTYVVFIGDNGWLLGEHGLTSKVLAYEASMRVPFVIAGPGIVPGTRSQMALNIDVTPTILDLAAIPAAGLDGVSLRPLFSRANTPLRSRFLYEAPAELGTRPITALRTADWKYIETGGGTVELYDLRADPHEVTNVNDATQRGKMAAELASLKMPGPVVVRREAGWPEVFELNVGEAHTVERKTVKRTVKLLGAEPSYFPDGWPKPNSAGRTWAQVAVRVDVAGTEATLLIRPYESPKVVNGLKLYAEAERVWATTSELGALPDMRKAIRLSATGADEPWSPQRLVFPIRGYRWRAGAYNNTWSALVPYNKLYYHRGEDLGAIPGRLEVVAVADGRITGLPGPKGDGGSNTFTYEIAGGLRFRNAHMDTEQIAPELQVGMPVRAGQMLGKTGQTYLGKPRQFMDPHLHWAVGFGETTLGSFPFAAQAYFDTYPDPAMPIAGGYYYVDAGEEIELDGSRSLARPERRIISHRWKLHDGREVDGARVRVRGADAGLFTEELIVKTDDGAEDRDFAQLRVWAPQPSRNLTFGWAYHSPVRDIRPGTPVEFWNRLNTDKNVSIDFGDGTPEAAIERTIKHAYAKAGLYTVTLRAPGAAVKLRVFVD